MAHVVQHPSCCWKCGSDATQLGLFPTFCKLSGRSPFLPSPLGRSCLAVAQTEGAVCAFQLSSTAFLLFFKFFYLMHSAIHIKLSPGVTPRKNEMHRDLCHAKIASLES